MRRHGKGFQEDKAFTLTELLIAIAIVGILAAIAIPAYTQHSMHAARKKAFADLLAVAMYENRYFALNLGMPTGTSGYANYGKLQGAFPNDFGIQQAQPDFTIYVSRYSSTGIGKGWSLKQSEENGIGGTRYYIWADPTTTGKLKNDTEYPCPCVRSDGVRGIIATSCKPHTKLPELTSLDEACIKKDW